MTLYAKQIYFPVVYKQQVSFIKYPVFQEALSNVCSLLMVYADLLYWGQLNGLWQLLLTNWYNQYRKNYTTRILGYFNLPISQLFLNRVCASFLWAVDRHKLHCLNHQMHTWKAFRLWFKWIAQSHIFTASSSRQTEPGQRVRAGL